MATDPIENGQVDDAVALLRSSGYSVSKRGRTIGLDQQQLWTCAWGSMTALVWAMSIEAAEERVRHQCFDRAATIHQVRRAPRLVNGEVTVREATGADLRRFEEAGGKVPA